MSEHRVIVDWQRNGATFDTGYVRDHQWRFEGGTVVGASSAPEMSGNAALVDPEQAFVASISSCHMMWFLFLAARRKLVVDSYVDDAVGTMGRDSEGVTWVQRVDLHPVVSFVDAPADAAIIERLHEEAHHRCFIANSVRSEIVVHPTPA